MELRGVQKECLEEIYASFKEGGTYHLIHACVGFGKTIIASELMRSAKVEYGAKCLFLCHLKELVVQTVDKFKTVAPDLSCGVVCGSLGLNEVQDITVGTRQTIVRNLDKFQLINLIIVDEVHLYSDQYQKIVDHFLDLNPRLRVLGVTGTPFNTRDGWIYGGGKRWEEPCFRADIRKMIDLSYLSKFRYKMADSMPLEEVRVRRGEFMDGDLENEMVKEVHMGSVKHAIADHCSGRKKILIFCVTIGHAEALAAFLGCHAVHSKLKSDVWRERVDGFKDGETRILINVGQLTIGFDAPSVDCLIVARPTMSASLHVQICGRGLRVADGKEDCLIVDLVGNYLRHGLPCAPKVRAPKEEQSESEKKEKESDICQECFEVVEAGLDFCPYCGAEMADRNELRKIEEQLNLKEIERKKMTAKFVGWKWKRWTTKRGFDGVLFSVSYQVSGKWKFLNKFCTDGTRVGKKTQDNLMALEPGEELRIISTAQGDWIA